jgi:hypothetical protein
VVADEPQGHWLRAARNYLVAVGLGNLLWEAAQFPLYTVWYEGSRGHQLLALLHGTVGDVFISAAALMASLVIFGDKTWPARAFWRVGVPMLVFGLGYTVYSEWINVEVRHTWAYSRLMPTVPPLGTGLSPLLEWLVVPVLALLVLRRAVGTGSAK